MMMSDELIRVAILWHEQWHEALEEASRLYFGERNIQGMLSKVRSYFSPRDMPEIVFFSRGW
jgi:phosphatidylinositol kinase/protein kinase (PI-3  family)